MNAFVVFFIHNEFMLIFIDYFDIFRKKFSFPACSTYHSVCIFLVIQRFLRYTAPYIGAKVRITAPILSVLQNAENPYTVGIAARCEASRSPFTAPTLSPASNIQTKSPYCPSPQTAFL